MSPHRLITILSLVLTSAASAQNYQTIHANRISYFGSQYQQVRCIRIDSTSYQSDSIFYPFRVMQELDYCFSPYVASWIGDKVIIKENGQNLFFNKQNDTIRIDTRAKLNEKWIAFHFVDSSYIEATISKHDTMNFLALNDSIKTIGFQLYNKTSNPLEHDINQMTLLISKSHGFVRTFNFYLFPDFEAYYPAEEFEELDLVGLSAPETGVQNITWFDVNDFQPGDELHILNESSSWQVYGDGYATTEKTIYKYIDRTDYEDSIIYDYSRRQSIFTDWQGSSTFSFFDDTLTSIIKPDALFDKLPGEPIILYNDTYSYYYYMTNDSKVDPQEIENFFNDGETCWFMPVVDGCMKYDYYLKGLGGPYYSCTNAFSFGGAERKLVYYKKGGTEWGTPLLITQASDPITNEIFVFPNPAGNYITIKNLNAVTGELIFSLFNITGRLIISQPIVNTEKTINLASVSPGIYVYRLIESDRVIAFGKLVIVKE